MLFLRACSEEDISHAANLMCLVYSEPPWNEKWQPERAQKRVKAFLSGINARAYAMIVDTEIVGYLFGRIDIALKHDVFYVEEMFVHPNYQRRGCGSMALAQLAGELKKTNIRRIELHTISEDISFYKKNGFAPSSFLYLEKEI